MTMQGYCGCGQLGCTVCSRQWGAMGQQGVNLNPQNSPSVITHQWSPFGGPPLPKRMTPAELREMVAAMRELGVIECDGIVLGPPPAQAVAESSALTEEQRERAMRGDRLQDIRDKLGDYTTPDAALERFLA